MPEALTVEDTESFEHSNEREFALLLLERGFEVYHEPHIRDCLAIPDFFVINPRTGNGKLIEITLRFKSEGKWKNRKSFFRKQRQKEALESCGIPCVILTRENQEIIRKNIWSKLF